MKPNDGGATPEKNEKIQVCDFVDYDKQLLLGMVTYIELNSLINFVDQTLCFTLR